MPGFLGFSWQNSSLKLQPFHESQVISISVIVIPGFLGYSLQCSSQLLQPLCESQDIFGNSWLSWLFLLFLLRSNSRLSLKAKSYLLLSRLFLEYHSRLSKKAKNFLAFPAFSRLFRGKKAWKSQESQALLFAGGVHMRIKRLCAKINYSNAANVITREVKTTFCLTFL